MADFDYVIVGGGAAGLLLCNELVTRPELADRRIALIDDGSYPVKDRAWGYWTSQSRWVDDLASTTWTKLDVFANGKARRLELSPYRYLLVQGAKLNTHVMHAAADADVTWIVDRIERIDKLPGGAQCVGRAGTYSATIAFDSRPPPKPREGEIRLQFLGWEVETPDAAFDDSVATFMDFRLREPGCVEFGYVLPTSPTKALVELASFTTRTPDHTAAGAQLERYVREQLRLDQWNTRRREFGDLALFRSDQSAGVDSVVNIGRRGGLLRPSTGYGFDRMVRHAQQIADGLVGHAGSPSALRYEPSRRHSYLDRVLLNVASTEPEILEPTFGALFAGNPLDRILRFLDEDSTKRDEARIVASLPKLPFMRAAARVRRRPGG